jgi:hypothetical protein
MNLSIKDFLRVFGNLYGVFFLFIAFFIPFGLFYSLFNLSASMVKNQIDSMTSKKYKVAWISENNQAKELRDKLELNLRIQLTDKIKEAELKDAILKDSISVGIVVSEKFDSAVSQQKKAGLKLYYEGQSKGLAMVEKAIAGYRKSIVDKNLSDLNLPDGLVSPLDIKENDLTDTQALIENAIKTLNNTVSSLLVLLLLIFGVVGARFALKRNLVESNLPSEDTDSGSQLSVLSAGVAFTFTMMLFSLLGLYLALSFRQEGIFEMIMLQLRSILTLDKLMLLMLTSIPLGMLIYGIWNTIFYYLKSGFAAVAANSVLVVLIFLSLVYGLSVESLSYNTVFLPYIGNVCAIKAILVTNYSFILLLINWLFTLVISFALLYLSAPDRKKKEIKKQ